MMSKARQKLIELVRTRIDEKEEFTTAEVVEELMAELEGTELLAEWIDEALRTAVREMVIHEIGRRRSIFTNSRPDRFAEAAEKYGESGDPSEFDPFDVVYVVGEDFIRRRVADMTGADHQFVAANYEASGRRDLMLAAFHTAVARRVGNQKTGEVLSRDDYLRLYDSIVRTESKEEPSSV